MKEIKQKIESLELKKINYNHVNSRDSHCFSANVYFNGKKCAEVSDDGWGGEMQTEVLNQKVYDLLELEIKKLPPYKFPDIEAEIEYSLDILVGDLVNEYLLDKETKKAYKRMDKLTLNSVVYISNENPLTYSYYQWKYPLETILVLSDGKDSIQKRIDEIKSKGYRIYNTNLPEDMLI